jgi:uncharacterized membrane protein YqjE
MTAQGVERDPREESVGELLGQLSSDISTLVRQEIALARVEMTEKGKVVGKGVGMLGGAGVVALLMLGALTTMLIALLAEVMEVWLAALIVTILWGIVAAVLAQRGKKQLKEAAPPKPEQTIETIKEDVQWAKTQMRSDTTSS